MASQAPANPYRPPQDDAASLAPFAGRQKAFEFLYQQLTDPAGMETTLIVGRHDSGKTALLHHFAQYFDESFVGVYVPLTSKPPAHEDAWLRLLADGSARALAERNYTLSRLPEYEGGMPFRTWFSETYLPELLNIIRRQRRLVFLVDDVNELLKAIEANHLPDDSIHFLNELVKANAQLGFVLTLDAQFEDDIPKLSPLVSLEDVFRLANLGEDDTAWLLNQPVSGYYGFNPDALTAVHRASGGQPRLVQRFGSHAFRAWEARPNRTTLTPEDVKQISAKVYSESEPDLRVAWSKASRNERLVLTAISSLIYADPLGKITPPDVETWLVETDYPLDSTAINAAIRGLEYQEIVEHSTAGIRLTASLMQSWLLENGRLDDSAPRPNIRRPLMRWLALGGLVLLIAVLVLVATQTKPPGDAIIEPTVTLVTNP
jgi:hypothetical protein